MPRRRSEFDILPLSTSPPTKLKAPDSAGAFDFSAFPDIFRSEQNILNNWLTGSKCYARDVTNARQ
jgi:hypothetical protein